MNKGTLTLVAVVLLVLLGYFLSGGGSSQNLSDEELKRQIEGEVKQAFGELGKEMQFK